MEEDLVSFGVFLMHEVPDECEKDNAVYQLQLHVSNRSSIF